MWMEFQELNKRGNSNMLSNFSSTFLRWEKDHLTIQKAKWIPNRFIKKEYRHWNITMKFYNKKNIFKAARKTTFKEARRTSAFKSNTEDRFLFMLKILWNNTYNVLRQNRVLYTAVSSMYEGKLKSFGKIKNLESLPPAISKRYPKGSRKIIL